LRQAFEELGDDLALAHAKDVRHDGTMVAAGQGDLDYGLYLELLAEHDRSVPVVLHGLTEAEVPGSIAFVRAAAPAA
jgi:sugar phosphate isomerase/epimerase